jgi:hypothetical protein
VSDPFFTGDELWSGPKRPIPGDSDSWDALAEHCNSKVEPLLEEIARLNSLVHTCHDDCRVAGCVNARLKADCEYRNERWEESRKANKALRALLARARDTVAFCEDGGLEADIVKEIDAMLGEK